MNRKLPVVNAQNRRSDAYGMSRKSMSFLLPIFVLIVITIIWEILARSVVDPLVPAPSSIWTAFIQKWDVLATDIPVTLLETLLGMIVAIVAGVLIAAVMDFLPLVKQAIYPLLIVSQTVPIIALAVLLILIFGFDIWPKVVVVVLFCFFPIAVAMTDGLAATDPDLIALLRAMGATRMQIWRKVRLPSAMPSFFSGLRIAATYSITGAIVGEYIVPNVGIGKFIRLAFSQGAHAQAFAAIVVTVILSIGLVVLVGVLERITLPWFFTQARHEQWSEPGIY